MEERSLLQELIVENPEMVGEMIGNLDYVAIARLCTSNAEIRRQCRKSPLKKIIEEKLNQSTIAIVEGYTFEEDSLEREETAYVFNLWLSRVGVNMMALTLKIRTQDIENMFTNLRNGTRFDGYSITTLSEEGELQGLVIEYFPTSKVVTILPKNVFSDIHLSINADVFKNILSMVIEIHEENLEDVGRMHLLQNGMISFVRH